MPPPPIMKLSGRTPSPSSGSIRVVRAVVLLILTACLFGSACSGTGSSSDLQITRQGDRAAFSFSDMWMVPLGPEVPVIRSVTYVGWCDLDRPKRLQRILIDKKAGSSIGAFEYNRVHPVFSPSGRRLAVAVDDRLLWFDLKDGRPRRLNFAGETVTSLAWLGENEIAYGVRTESDRFFCAQKIEAPPENRREIFAEPSSRPEQWPASLSHLGWPWEAWSPDGRYMAFVPFDRKSTLNLLDIRTGRRTRAGRRPADQVQVSWREDGSALFCLNTGREGGVEEAFLLETVSGDTKDFSRDMAASFQGGGYLRLSSLWTPDGRNFAVNRRRTGGCLIRPAPWRVVPVYASMTERLKRRARAPVLVRDEAVLGGELTIQPVDGWVTVLVGVAAGQYGPPGHEFPVYDYWDYAVSYDATQIVPLGKRCGNCDRLILTPDGRRMVVSNSASTTVTVSPIDLPPLNDQGS